jgi:hypothetical protein
MNETFDLSIRIHHFFDIIRDFGIQNEIPANTLYLHSYHTVADSIHENPNIRMKIVLGVDSVCQGCIHNVNNSCDDLLTRKEGFTMKNDYNDYLDKRILEACQINIGHIMTPNEICLLSDKYINNIESIYKVDSEDYIRKRKKDFIAGLHYFTRSSGLH